MLWSLSLRNLLRQRAQNRWSAIPHPGDDHCGSQDLSCHWGLISYFSPRTSAYESLETPNLGLASRHSPLYSLCRPQRTSMCLKRAKSRVQSFTKRYGTPPFLTISSFSPSADFLNSVSFSSLRLSYGGLIWIKLATIKPTTSIPALTFSMAAPQEQQVHPQWVALRDHIM